MPNADISLRMMAAVQRRRALGLMRDTVIGVVLLGAGATVQVMAAQAASPAGSETLLIDDFTDPGLRASNGASWRAVSDRVMGGVSQASLSKEQLAGRLALHLSGQVRLDNDGGFIQASLDLGSDGDTLDASAFTGIRLAVLGNGEKYGVHLRTPDNVRPWQSYRSAFTAGPDWQQVELPFAGFVPHRIDTPLDLRRLRRIGLVAIGRAFQADLAVSDLALYR